MNKGDIVYYAETKGSFKPLRAAHNRKKLKPKVALLWGDPLYVVSASNGSVEVSAKGHILQLPDADVMTTPLLSLYQIDCGQGDAALIHTPDDRWIMIDGGPSPKMANSPALGVNFLWWKIFVDQCWRQEFGIKTPFKLDAVVVTHPDEDHFGGFPELIAKVKPGGFEIGTIFHNGMGRFDGAATAYSGGKGFGQLGPVEGDGLPDAGLTTFIDDHRDIKRFSQTAPGRSWKLTGNYANFLAAAAKKVGAGIGEIRRVGHARGTPIRPLPGFGANGDIFSIQVLGPVVEQFNNKPGLRFLDGASQAALKSPSLTRNGHSIVLRIDYDKFRLLMTGDLNFKSHAVLLQNVNPKEFSCHVAKACHHGAEDIACAFLQAMNPLATLFSSGDNETYAHPRAKALAFSAAFGQQRRTGRKNKFLGLSEDQLAAPLIYSTELSRSVELFGVHSILDATNKVVNGSQIIPTARSYGRTLKPGQAQLAKDWLLAKNLIVGSSRVDLQACKLEYSIVSPK